jgi:hypothetical protein
MPSAPIPPFVVSARSVNPEAGNHLVAADPHALGAALAATRRSWREFPYYARRYGERGRRFSLSDSGWIVTLCQLAEQQAIAETRWLGRLLAARGMPRYLLERHLRHLYDELRRGEEPWRTTEDLALLIACSDDLRSERVAQIAEDDFLALAADFEDAVRHRRPRVANMGSIVVAAVADELAGIDAALSSLSDWTHLRFDADWVAAFDATVHAVHAASARRGSLAATDGDQLPR